MDHASMRQSDGYEFLFYPKVVSGQCALENLPSELDGHNARKPLVITSKAVTRDGRAKRFVKAFYDSVVIIGAIYDPVLDYAGISQAQEAARLFTDRGCDAIIALGGGPVVALAKAVNVLVSEKRETLQSFYEGAPIGHVLKPLIVVATGAIDGREASPSMTVDNRVIVSDMLYPEAFILDERMTVGDSPQTVAESGVIALSQAFTALTVQGHNPMIDALAHPALALLAQHLIPAVRRPKDRAAGLALANAAVMAGAAYTNSGPGLSLLLAEALGAATGIRVGQCLGVLLPFAVTALLESNRPARDELCLAMAGLDGFAAIPEKDRPRRGLDMVLSLLHGLKGIFQVSLGALKVQQHLLDAVAQAAAGNSAGRFTAAQCRSLLDRAWAGTAGWQR